MTKRTGDFGAVRRTWLGWVAFVLVLASGTAAALYVARMNDATPSAVTYTVVPHADDEFQTWSLIEDTPDQYKVFIVMTQSEQTGYCEPETYALSYQAGLEAPADPTPDGRWGPGCEQARTNSLIDYISDMSGTDSTIPGDFGAPNTVGPFPADPGTVCRADGPTCTEEDHTARVWVDRLGRGAVVMLNLGDGDLTTDEVRWGISTVLANRAALGLNAELRNAGLFGSFANSRYDCFSYPHPDHVAVHDALWSTNFGAGPQLGATCKDDPARTIKHSVSDEATEAAFEVGDSGRRLGAHTNNYGWLHAAYYPVDRKGQSELFTQHQYFWARFVQ